MAVVMAHNPDAPLFVEPDPVDVLRNALLKAGVLTTEQIDVAKEETPVAIVVAAVDSK
jgi:TPP-dependent pyruvate/acetoin dehydrogenase alpha subunit